jgi:hypothetical protein
LVLLDNPKNGEFLRFLVEKLFERKIPRKGTKISKKREKYNPSSRCGSSHDGRDLPTAAQPTQILLSTKGFG